MRFALLALAFAGSALAQPVPQATPGAASFPVSTVRNISTIGTGTINPSNVGRYAFAHAIGGNVVADASTGLPLPDGRTLPVTVTSSIPKANATAAIGRFLRKGLPIVGTGVALYDLGQELGFGLSKDPGGATVVSQVTTSTGCAKYGQRPQFTACGDWTPTPALPTWVVQVNSSGTRICYAQDHCIKQDGSLVLAYNNFGGPADAPVTSSTPSTPEAFDTALNNRTSWAPSSALGRSLVDAIKAGELIQAPPQTVTGPASTPGPVKTTTDAVNNTTKTETTRYDHSYSGPNVTTTINTTTVTVDNSTGATISSTTTTEQPTLPEKTQEEEEDTTFSNADLPPIPKLYDPEFPDGLEGVWNDRKAQLLDTSLFQLIPSLMPNMGDGGCPTWSIPSIYGGNLNASIPCSVWYFIRLVIILSALLLARRLIFGG